MSILPVPTPDLQDHSDDGEWLDVVNALKDALNRRRAGTFEHAALVVSIGTGLTLGVSFPVTGSGLIAGMPLTVTPPAGWPSGLIPVAYVITDGHLAVKVSNVSAGALSVPAGAWSYMGVVL